MDPAEVAPLLGGQHAPDQRERLGTLNFALVWRTEAENDLIRALADTVRDLGVFRF
ncbi:hypothetical protein ACGFMM_23560 [Streptomyces sp. NPDC048604]|uniref:hypothetical protein n=1 Tax=Streptomyces sp. NPDC048604 TaxID=3365578 RepID=UPI0037173066